MTNSVKHLYWTKADAPYYNSYMKADELIIYADMDGTALSDWSRGPIVPEENLRALESFVAQGGLFSVASGRQYPDIMDFFPEGLICAPVVCGNGAIVYSPRDKKVVREILLPKEFRREVLELCEKRTELVLAAADEYGIYQVRTGDGHPAPDGLLSRYITQEDFLTGPYVKACYILPDPALMQGVEEATALFASYALVTAVRSSSIYLEIIRRDVSKAAGIAYARDYIGAGERKLACIGDYFNDYEMLKSADIAACPSNAAQGIKDICDIVTCSNDEGAIARLITALCGE